jgi:hypothetical protein
MHSVATEYPKIKDDKVFHTWVRGSKLTKAYMIEKKTSLRTTPKKPKALRGRP